MNNFLLIVDQSSFDRANQLEGLLNNHRHVTDWLRSTPGVYLLKSDLADASSLMETVDTFFDQNGFLIVKVGFASEEIDGREDSAFWRLLYKGIVPDEAAKAIMKNDA